MKTAKETKSVPRNGFAASLRTKRSVKFRHKADRRAKDARRDETRGW